MLASGKRNQWRMTSADVARLAGVERAVVSVWRSRFPQDHATPFPAPISMEGKNHYFSPHAVVDWLTSTGHGNNANARDDLPLHMRAFPAIDGESMTALLALRHGLGSDLCDLSPDGLLDAADEFDPNDDWLFREIDSLAEELPRAAEAVDAVAGASFSAAHAFDVLERLHADTDAQRVLSTAAGDFICDLAEAAARTVIGDDAHIRLLDQTGRSAAILARLVERLDGIADVRIGSPHLDDETFRSLRRRLSLAGVPFESIAVGDVGDFAVEGPVVILSQHPVRASDEPLAVFDAMENIVAQLTRQQCAIVIAPAAVLIDELSDTRARTTRRQLIASGRLRAAIRLPKGCVPAHPRQRLAMWVLGYSSGPDNADSRRTYVSALGAQNFGLADREALVGDVIAAWGDPRIARERVFTRGARVPEATLKVSSSSLVTDVAVDARPDTPAAPEDGAHRRERLSRLEQAATSRIGPVLTGLFETRNGYAPREATLGQLAGDRHLSIRPGARIAAHHIGGIGFVVVGPEELSVGDAPGARQIDRELFAQHYPKVSLTLPGDVVFVTSPTPRAWVDVDGATVPLSPARVIRLNQADANAAVPELIAAGINAQPVHARDWQTWTVRRLRYVVDREDLLDPETRELSLREQRTAMRELEINGYRRLRAQVDALRQSLQHRLALLDEIDELVADGVSAGILTTLPTRKKHSRNATA